MTTPVLIPILNGRELTRACIKSVLAQDVPVEVFVIDNGSTDGSAEMLRSWGDKRVHYIPARRPSVAASWNYALSYVFNEGATHALLLNNDTLLRPDTVRLLLEEQSDFVTCVSRNTQDCLAEPLLPKDQWNRRPRPDFSCYLISKECYEKVGKFDEVFRSGFFEDNSYHIRMHKAGIRAYCIDVPFYHVGSATLKNASEEDRKRISDDAHRNKELFFEMYKCYPATPEYDALFGEDTFGMNSHVARMTQPLQVSYLPVKGIPVDVVTVNFPFFDSAGSTLRDGDPQ